MSVQVGQHDDQLPTDVPNLSTFMVIVTTGFHLNLPAISFKVEWKKR